MNQSDTDAIREEIKEFKEVDTNLYRLSLKDIQRLIARQVAAAEIEGMKKAKSRVLRRTEIPKGARNPTRDATVMLGEAIADIIQLDIAELQAATDKGNL